MHFFRTFKKSTAPYKVHNMGPRYINTDYSCISAYTVDFKYYIRGNQKGSIQYLDILYGTAVYATRHRHGYCII